MYSADFACAPRQGLRRCGKVTVPRRRSRRQGGLADWRLYHVHRTSPRHPSDPVAWNKGRIVGQKRPLQPKHVWSIRVRLEMAGDTRDLALFNMAVDSKLRGCDLVACASGTSSPPGA